MCITAAQLYVSPGLPTSADIDQDDIDDAAVVAMVGALADARTENIRDAIRYDDATETFEVRVYLRETLGSGAFQARPIWIPVTQADLQDNIRRHGASKLDNAPGSDAAAWPAVVETALAKMAGGGLADYEALGRMDVGDVVFHFTGRKSWEGDPHEHNLALEVSAAMATGFPVIVVAADQGSSASRYVQTLLSPWLCDPPAPFDGLKDGGVYTVAGIDESAAGGPQLILRNPAGHNDGADGQGAGGPELRVALDTLVKAGDTFIMGANNMPSFILPLY